MSFLVVNALTPGCTDEKRLNVRDKHLAYGKRNRDLVRLSSRTFSPDSETLADGFFRSSVTFAFVQLPEETAS